MRFNIFDIHLNDLAREKVRINRDALHKMMKEMIGKMPSMPIVTAVQQKPLPRQWYIPQPSLNELHFIDYVDLMQTRIK